MGNLDTTLGYARLYDRTLAQDYYTAMEQVEMRPEVTSPEAEGGARSQVNDNEQAELLGTQLAQPYPGIRVRLDLVD